MPGLSFLAKKSWHTANLNNQEKVWIAQQQKAVEETKIKELAKQIQQEREEDELNHMAGTKRSRLDRGIDWMYQGSAGAGSGEKHAYEEEQQEKDAEDFLLGKEYNHQNVKSGDFCKVEETAVGVAAIVNNASSAAAETEAPFQPVRPTPPTQTTNSAAAGPEDESQKWNQDFRLKLEDPMFMVSQRKKEKERDEQRKRDLFERVKKEEKPSTKRRKDRRGSNPPLDGDGSESSHRRDRKRRKKKHKRKHHRRKQSRSRSRSHTSRDDEDSRNEHQYSRTRSSRRDDRRSRRRTMSPSRSRSYSHSPDSSRPRSGRRYHSTRRSGRDRSPSYERSRSRDSGGPHRYRSHQRRSRSRSKSNHSERNIYKRGEAPKRRNQVENGPRSEQQSRGSQSNGRPVSNDSAGHSRSLGPDPKLLAKKRQEKEAARNRYRRQGSSRVADEHEGRSHHSKLSREERNAAIRDMQSDAGSRRSRLAKVAVQPSQNSKLLDDERRMRESKGRNFRDSGNFLTEMERKVNGIDTDISMSARVARNRHGNQRRNDESFL